MMKLKTILTIASGILLKVLLAMVYFKGKKDERREQEFSQMENEVEIRQETINALNDKETNREKVNDPTYDHNKWMR